MQWLADNDAGSKQVAGIINAAGGRVVGRTRLQKMVYLLTVTGFDYKFSFEYRHYGPYSEELASAVSLSRIDGRLREVQHPATWGGTYSVFTATSPDAAQSADPDLCAFIKRANEANSIDLELAATAVFLAKQGSADAWGETANLKPDKVGRLSQAKALLQDLSQLQVPEVLPKI